MKKFIVLSLGALLTASLWQSAMAQPPGGGPGRPGGFGGPGRGMRMGDRDKMELNRLWHGIDGLEKSKTPLSKAQAKSVVALVKPWSSKPQMTSAQAKTLAAKINAVLTPAQKSALAKMGPGRDGRRGEGRGEGRPDGPPPGENRNGQGRGGEGRPGGPPPGGFDPAKMRAMMQKMEAFQKVANPFYPPTKYAQVKAMPARMQEGMTRRYNHTRDTLAALSRKAG